MFFLLFLFWFCFAFCFFCWFLASSLMISLLVLKFWLIWLPIFWGDSKNFSFGKAIYNFFPKQWGCWDSNDWLMMEWLRQQDYVFYDIKEKLNFTWKTTALKGSIKVSGCSFYPLDRARHITLVLLADQHALCFSVHFYKMFCVWDFRHFCERSWR